MALSSDEWNRNNREAWRVSEIETDRLSSDPVLFEEAMILMRSELPRGVPAQSQFNFHQSVRVANATRSRVLTAQAQKGGQADKRDALQRHIDEIVRRQPRMTLKDLLALLKQQSGISPIIEVDETNDEILFSSGASDALKSASIEALKHRLTRARKNRGR